MAGCSARSNLRAPLGGSRRRCPRNTHLVRSGPPKSRLPSPNLISAPLWAWPAAALLHRCFGHLSPPSSPRSLPPSQPACSLVLLRRSSTAAARPSFNSLSNDRDRRRATFEIPLLLGPLRRRSRPTPCALPVPVAKSTPPPSCISTYPVCPVSVSHPAHLLSPALRRLPGWPPCLYAPVAASLCTHPA